LTWRHGDRVTGSIGIRVATNLVELDYRVRDRGDTWRDVSEPVFLDWTACHYGGNRPWFCCPVLTCGRRCAILYGVGDHFVCRRCGDLRYESQREDDLDRARVRTQAIRHRLGGDGNIFAPFPDKPKGMHWSTYSRLCEKADAFGERGWFAAFLAYSEKSDRWLGRLGLSLGQQDAGRPPA
jgi:hypothetical protein